MGSEDDVLLSDLVSHPDLHELDTRLLAPMRSRGPDHLPVRLIYRTDGNDDTRRKRCSTRERRYGEVLRQYGDERPKVKRCGIGKVHGGGSGRPGGVDLNRKGPKEIHGRQNIDR